MLLKDVKNVKEVVLTGNDLSLEELVAVSRYDAKIKVDPDAIDRIKASRALIDDIVDNESCLRGDNRVRFPLPCFHFQGRLQPAPGKPHPHSFLRLWQSPVP